MAVGLMGPDLAFSLLAHLTRRFTEDDVQIMVRTVYRGYVCVCAHARVCV